MVQPKNLATTSNRPDTRIGGIGTAVPSAATHATSSLTSRPQSGASATAMRLSTAGWKNASHQLFAVSDGKEARISSHARLRRMVRDDGCQCAPKQGMRRRIVSPILGGQEALIGLGFLRVEQRGIARRIRVRQCCRNGAAQMQEREVRHIPQGSNSARHSASISIAEPTHLSTPCRGRCGPLLGR